MPKTQREQIDELRDEIASLREQISALSVAVAQLAARAPSITYVYSPPASPQVWPRPWTTISGNTFNPQNTGIRMDGQV